MQTAEIRDLLASSTVSHVHCIGLGGIGVGGIAEWLIKSGMRVSGSDRQEGPRLEYYRSLGVTVFVGHQADHIAGADLVVYTSAAKADHPERVAAEQAGIPVCSRGHLLAALLQGKRSIIVSGSHGKTTTTALTAVALRSARVPVNYYLGGTIGESMSTVSVDDEDAVCVVESDESDASFLYLDKPDCLIITNIDADHLQTYGDSMETLRSAFLTVLSRVPDHGLGILCADDPGIQAILPEVTVPHVSYGFSDKAAYQITVYEAQGLRATVVVQAPDGSHHRLTVPMPGQHNALNAVAAWLACRWASPDGLGDSTALWNDFPGVARRFMLHGERSLPCGAVQVVEDYGHHPREIAVTIEAARLAWPDKRLVMLFQPHRYTRTADLKQAFIDVLATVDQLILMEVYSAGEEPIPGVNAQALAEAIAQQAAHPPVCVLHNEALKTVLHQTLQANDVLLLQGAGNVGVLGLKALD